MLARRRAVVVIFLLLITSYLLYKASVKFGRVATGSKTNMMLGELYLPEGLDVHLFRATPIMKQSVKSKLPRLDTLAWPDGTLSSFPTAQQIQNNSILTKPGPFQPVLSYDERLLFQKLLKTVADILFHNGFGDRFMLSADAVLGSFRHHDIVPWADHSGFLVDVTIRVKVRSLLRTLSPEILLHQTPTQDIVFAKTTESSENHMDLQQSRFTTLQEYGWPHIHIEYFEMNGTHITSIKQARPPRYAWPYDVVFPLYLRPFGSDWFPAPRNPKEFLRWRYGSVDLCETQSKSHIMERLLPLEMIPCSDLGERYAFVEHRVCGPGVQVASNDEMMLGEERLMRRIAKDTFDTIHQICLAAPVESIKCDMYTLRCADPY
ncbi:hypothetical protein CRM22_007310 [Opisthorchis felineus]|uniref:Uncharacterized protein n=1 Tax=Opisthorchis felineus TaxID=147828 RepID=A0A4S2LIJ5_OPIFE|nr:hypothetical protein CRM22_007310 [Opisthorchis felineus]TGZ62632.1 hypothetical protein CRM22_007310 [Opisthorchis felineus]TGZ62633.1 hypothetical protein CRM22_007310 [Opisthorchis felineus]TGZ62634.1 hypothetical protein CRM22_007310 [Opisthorchis felineus]TGZ62635.1 hypothetical protein CRM22_007310 [Opisthorchis felineus]